MGKSSEWIKDKVKYKKPTIYGGIEKEEIKNEAKIEEEEGRCKFDCSKPLQPRLIKNTWYFHYLSCILKQGNKVIRRVSNTLLHSQYSQEFHGSWLYFIYPVFFLSVVACSTSNAMGVVEIFLLSKNHKHADSRVKFKVANEDYDYGYDLGWGKWADLSWWKLAWEPVSIPSMGI